MTLTALTLAFLLHPVGMSIGLTLLGVAVGVLVNFGAYNQDAAAQMLLFSGSIFTTTALVNATMPQGYMTGAGSVYATSTGNGANALTTRTAAQLYADLALAIGFNPPIGYSYDIRITNTGNNTVTPTAGAGVTINGSPLSTIATNTFRDFVCTVTGASSFTMQSTGTGTVS
jgi:hypothetical protein